MTRKKVNLVWIASDSARKASLKKRRGGLMKKVSELTTLCGVNAFAVIFSPDEKEPAMWPSRPVIHQLLARFHTLPEMERGKKMMNQERYFKERSTKVEEQLKKHQRRNKEMDVSHLMHLLFHYGKRQSEFNVIELHGLFWFVQEKKKEIKKRLDYFQQVNALQEAAASPPPLALPPPPPAAEDEMPRTAATGDARNPVQPAQWDQWFMEVVNNGENNMNLGLRTPNQTIFAANQMGLPLGNFRSNYNNFASTSSNIIPNSDQMGLLYGTNFRDLNLSGGGDDTETRLPSEFEFLAGSSDVGMPFDVTKPWPNNFYP
ncbi:agamous-like MADS-box protein AGL80 [Pistacia vera]|uniref:agamous-like MADS-box protein AGL80 n=1 Tax=Pistacia vera TaxID=55513 RepID=UPI001263380C|nr:agamous-like MADS-box protein AGL80 [Pistacia vera]XP_031279103.1 agamous-like MADS-box protein AGL80 [Pistacia vera]